MKTCKPFGLATAVAVLLGLLTGPGAWGQLLIQKGFGTATGTETMGAMTTLRTGGYLVAGVQNFFRQAGQLYLLRLNGVGDTVWTRRYTMPGFYGLYVSHALEDAAGRVLLVGHGGTFNGTTQDDAYLLLLNAQGDTLWTRRTQSPFPDSYSQPQLTSAGDFMLTANLAGVPQLLRVSPAGQVVQQVIVPFSNADLGQIGGLLPTSNGGYWVTSYNTSPPYTGNFIRFDATGTPGMQMPVPVVFPAFYDFYFDGSGYLVASGDGVTRLDANLNVLWSRTFTARGYLFGPYFIRPTLDNNFLLGGQINTPSGGQDLGFAKISPGGIPLKDTVLVRPGNETLCGLAVAPGTGNYVFSGWTTIGPIGGADIFWGELRRSTITATRTPPAGGPTLTAYPNPLGTAAAVHLSASQPLRGTFCLRDALGRALRTWPASGGLAQELPLPDLAAGVYLLTLTDGQGRRQTLRLVSP